MKYTTLIMGSMYSGKSEELKRIMKRNLIAGKKCQIFKPKIDNRYSETKILTHANASVINKLTSNNLKEIITNAMGLDATPVGSSEELMKLINPDTEVVGIDEVQFFDNNIINAIEELNKKNIEVVASGLDMYASGDPFTITSILACTCKYVQKLHAVCVDCGEEAMYSYMIDDFSGNEKSKIKIGSNGKYIALCENCKEKRLKK